MKMKTILIAWLLTGVLAVGQGLTVGTNYSAIGTNITLTTAGALTLGNSAGSQIFETVGTTSEIQGYGPAGAGGYFDFAASASTGTLGVGTDSVGSWTLSASTNASTKIQLVGEINGTNVVIMDPDVTDSGSQRYKFGTTRTQSSGTMLNVANNETNVFSIGFNGNARIGSVTKAQKTAMTAADGMIVYQTDNTAGFRVRIGGTWFILSTAADP